MEYTQGDTHIGAYGARYITCPCCNYENMIDNDDGITLTKDNVSFPKHYHCISRDAVKLPDEEINAYVKQLIETYQKSKDKDDWCRFIGTGDTLVTVYKFDNDEGYYVVVAKDYYETYIPFEAKDYT